MYSNNFFYQLTMGSPGRIFELFLQSFLLSTVLLVTLDHVVCQVTDTITSNSSIKDPDTIVSAREIFKLGFFTPANSTNRYLGIFYVFSENNVVWVANKNKPLKDSSGILTISRDGNLVLMNGQNQTMWSTNVTTLSPMNTTAQILDTGNLVLGDVSSESVIWESFMHPTHVLLPQMKSYKDNGSTKKESLWSWKNNSDPAVGNFSSGMEFRKIPELFIWNNGNPYWRTGPWNGRILLGVLAELNTLSGTGFRIENDESGTLYVTMSPEDRNLLLKATLSPSGRLLTTFWDERSKTWIQARVAPDHECDIYGKCGPFGSCNREDSPICSCLRGFEPRDIGEWNRGNWTGGCVRRKQLQCSRENNTWSSNGRDNDGFYTMRFMKLPDFLEQFTPTQEDECKTRCLRNCSCIAYAYDTNIGCMFWSETLIDVQQFPGLGPDLHIRLVSSELDHNVDVKLIIIIVVASMFILIFIFIGWRWMLKLKVGRGNDKYILDGRQADSSDVNSVIFTHEFNKFPTNGLPKFTLDVLAKATNEFHRDNLLGKGGFGPVYKGTLTNGKEIAVKRLSTTSEQGTKEFTNEVLLISKLQHRNLVRLIGYCVDKEEKMLVYEYMPNKSLDACLFDHIQSQQEILDWRTRFSIIEGVGRGLLYLHKDSRLKIIHRDLKPSNVLLDANWSPKISDFGLARIFGGNQDHGNSLRVVGTYGYMSPEYATEGRFSEKSDVYSFGVLMLEIISGKKNTHYYNKEVSLSLLGCAWKFWSEENSSAFVDQTLMETSNSREDIMRSIHIALLCVQEFPKDRPDIQTVLSMLSKEITDLARPEKPAFAEKWRHFHISSTESSREHSFTMLDRR